MNVQERNKFMELLSELETVAFLDALTPPAVRKAFDVLDMFGRHGYSANGSNLGELNEDDEDEDDEQ